MLLRIGIGSIRPYLVAACKWCSEADTLPLDRPGATPSVHSGRFPPLTGGCFLERVRARGVAENKKEVDLAREI